MNRLEKVIKWLECCAHGVTHCLECPYDPRYKKELREPSCMTLLARETLELLKAQNEVIQDLRKIGYPHNFQRGKPWIVNYMYAITEVIKKAVRLNNEHPSS